MSNNEKLTSDRQVNVGGIISNTLDLALKNIIQQLVAASGGDGTVGQHPAFATVSAHIGEERAAAIANIPASELASFLSQYSGVSYRVDLLPALPSLTVTQPKPLAMATSIAPEGENPELLGGGISIGITGTWSF